MANQLPNNLYSGYAQVVDTRPSIQFAANLLARREARRDAMDRYLQDATSRVTTTGMRDQEIEPLMQAKSNVQKYYLENRDRLRNNDAKTMLEWKSLLNTMQDIAQSSIAASKPSRELLKVTLEKPDIKSRWDERTAKPMIEANESPTHIIGEDGRVTRNEQYHPLEVAKIVMNPKEWGANEWNAYSRLKSQVFKPDKIVTDTVPNPKDPYRQIEITTSLYLPEKQSAMIDDDKNRFENDEELRFSFNKNHDLLNTPLEKWQLEHTDEYDKLNEVFRNAKGENIQTDADLFAASQLAPLLAPTITPKSVDNYAAKSAQRFADTERHAAANDARIRGRMRLAQGFKEALIDYRQAKTTEAQDGILNKFIDNTFESGTDRIGGTTLKRVTIDGKDYTGKLVELPNSVKDEYTIYKGEENGVKIFDKPDAFYLTDDKKSIIPLHLGDKTVTGGNYLETDSKPIPIQNLKVSLSKLLLTKTATGGEVVDEFDVEDGTAPAPKKTTTTKEVHRETRSGIIEHTRQDFKNAGWTDEQIDKALKAGKIKIR